ncbi:MAG: class II aldolase/adducin family protein, partial [Candidatus Bathyarchaeia archaeon]
MVGERELRQRLCRIGRRLYERHLTSGAGGSISARTAKEDEVLIKPSGFTLADLSPRDIVKVNLKGDVLEGKYRPSSD